MFSQTEPSGFRPLYIGSVANSADATGSMVAVGYGFGMALPADTQLARERRRACHGVQLVHGQPPHAGVAALVQRGQRGPAGGDIRRADATGWRGLFADGARCPAPGAARRDEGLQQGVRCAEWPGGGECGGRGRRVGAVGTQRARVAAGEYLQASGRWGYAERQADAPDEMRNSTVAKATIAVDFEPPLVQKQVQEQEEYETTEKQIVQVQRPQTQAVTVTVTKTAERVTGYHKQTVTKTRDFTVVKDANGVPVGVRKGMVEQYEEEEVVPETEMVTYEQQEEVQLPVLDEAGNVLQETVTETQDTIVMRQRARTGPDGQPVLQAVVDEAGQAVLQPLYRVKYLDAAGQEIEREAYEQALADGDVAHRAAFVPCTYHCA